MPAASAGVEGDLVGREDPTWRIIRVSKYLVTSIYKPWKCYLQGEQPQLGDVLTKVMNHLLIGMILQVLGPSHSKRSKETKKLA